MIGGIKKYTGVAKSAIGSSHKKSGKECQDSSGYYNKSGVSAVIVSDGHGSEKHFRSSRGSSLIKEVFELSIPEFVKTAYKQKKETDADPVFKWYIKYLLFAWREKIEYELIKDPIESDIRFHSLSEKDAEEVRRDPYIAYGATMILAIYCGEFFYIAQLGDGDARVFVQKGIESPIPEDGRLKFGRTTSLCNKDALSHVRNIILPANAVKGCFLSSDGVRNSFDSEENYNKFVQTVLDEMENSDSALSEDLDEFLPGLSENGSGDDVSVAAIIKQ